MAYKIMDKEIHDLAVRAARKAGEKLLYDYKTFRRQSADLKSEHEIITASDLASEKIILEEIKKIFPEHGILSEEAGRKPGQGEYLWIVDPLDGTTNFSMHNPLWAVSIGVAKMNKIVLGVIYAPYLGEIFIAEEGRGATCNGEKIKVSDITQGKVINAFCHGSDSREIRKAIKYFSRQKMDNLDCRQIGSASIELSYVASGRIESIMIPGANSWDVAAGVLIVREAGGKVTDFQGKKWNLKSRDILASNGKVHDDILKVINKN